MTDQQLVTIEFARPEIDPRTVPYHGRPGRAAAIRTIFRAAQERGARTVAVFDAGLTDLAPDWIDGLVGPALGGSVDYVSAFHVRHPYEGAITKSIVSPLFRALYGIRLRQPAAPEFGCSSPLMEYFLDQAFWEAEAAAVGVDLWLATSAAAGQYRVGESGLGTRAVTPKPETPDLSETLAQLVGALFLDMDARADAWQRVRGSRPVPLFGAPPAVTPVPPNIDIDALVESYRLGYDALRDVWAWVLPPRTMIDLKKLADAAPARFRVGDETWAKIVYDFALAYRMQTLAPEHLLGALTPLYRGWLASFVLEPDTAVPEVADRRLEELGAAFEAQKPYLISRWRWPERFRS